MPKVETWRKRKGLKSIGLTAPPLSTMVVGDAKLNADVAFGRVPNGDIACVECGYHVHAPGCPKVKRDAETRQFLDDCDAVGTAVDELCDLIGTDHDCWTNATLFTTGVWNFEFCDAGRILSTYVESGVILERHRAGELPSLAKLIFDAAKAEAVPAQTFSNTLSDAWKPNIEALRKAREEWKLKMERDALTFSTYRLPFIKDDGAKW